jgi:hypothetical protein
MPNRAAWVTFWLYCYSPQHSFIKVTKPVLTSSKALSSKALGTVNFPREILSSLTLQKIEGLPSGFVSSLDFSGVTGGCKL